MSKFTTTPLIYYGVDALKQSKEAILTYGKKALLVTDEVMINLRQTDYITDIFEKIGTEYEVFSDIAGEPDVETVKAAAKAFKDSGAEYLVALGGGSVLDTGKAVSMMVSMDEGEELSDFVKKDFVRKKVRLIAIPTTSGTGSEVTKFTIITDTKNNVKMLLKGDGIMPDMAIAEPKFTLSMPESVTVATGVDALCHAIESYISIKANPMSKQYSISAIRHIFANLPNCIGEERNLRARAKMSLAAMQAGIAFSNSSVTLIHGMSRPIGALFHVPHGNSNAMLLISCLDDLKDRIPDRIGRLARLCGVSTEVDDLKASHEFLGYLKCFIDSLGVKNIYDYGVSKEDFIKNLDKMSEDALESGSPANIGIDYTVEDIKKIYMTLV